MPLVFTTAHLVRVDFFPRPQFAGAQFASKDAKFVRSKGRWPYENPEVLTITKVINYIDKLAFRSK